MFKIFYFETSFWLLMRKPGDTMWSSYLNWDRMICLYNHKGDFICQFPWETVRCEWERRCKHFFTAFHSWWRQSFMEMIWAITQVWGDSSKRKRLSLLDSSFTLHESSFSSFSTDYVFPLLSAQSANCRPKWQESNIGAIVRERTMAYQVTSWL